MYLTSDTHIHFGFIVGNEKTPAGLGQGFSSCDYCFFGFPENLDDAGHGSLPTGKREIQLPLDLCENFGDTPTLLPGVRQRDRFP